MKVAIAKYIDDQRQKEDYLESAISYVDRTQD